MIPARFVTAKIASKRFFSEMYDCDVTFGLILASEHLKV